MALGLHWSLKNITLLIGSCVFLIIYWTSRHSINYDYNNNNNNNNVLSGDDNPPEWTPEQPMHHKLDWDLPDTYTPPAPPPRPPKPPPIPWAEAKFAHDAEEAAKRRKAEHEKKVAELPENKKKAAEILKKVAAEQQKALVEQSNSPPNAEGRMPFQSDLSVQIPRIDTVHLRRYNPHNWEGAGHVTIATYLTTPAPSTTQDPYFISVLQLAYRILWDPRTKSKHTFTVFVAPHIPQSQRDVLSAVGCLVKQLDPVEESPVKEEGQKKWQFAKLHLWSQWDFSRILFLDADAFPFQPIDPLLDLPQLGCKRELLPMEDAPLADILCQYSFNVAPQGFQKEGDQFAELNVGVMLLQPNDSMQKRLLRGLKSFKGDSLQEYLSEMFRNDGPFPWEGLDRSWNGFFPQEDEQTSLKIVHEKLWMGVQIHGDAIKWAKDDWLETHDAMVNFFNGKVFVAMREKDGVRSFE